MAVVRTWIKFLPSDYLFYIFSQSFLQTLPMDEFEALLTSDSLPNMHSITMCFFLKFSNKMNRNFDFRIWILKTFLRPVKLLQLISIWIFFLWRRKIGTLAGISSKSCPGWPQLLKADRVFFNAFIVSDLLTCSWNIMIITTTQSYFSQTLSWSTTRQMSTSELFVPKPFDVLPTI